MLSNETVSVFPGESGSLAEGISQGSGESSDVNNSAAFNFTGHTASANGATMQEYFIQAVVSSPSQYDLLLSRLRGLCRQWSDFCDQEIVYELGSDSKSNDASMLTNQSSGNSSAAAGLMAGLGSSSVTMRLRRSLLNNLDRKEYSVLRYLGVVETDKVILRRSCLDIPVTGPLSNFLFELGFEREFSYVAEGQIFVRGRVKIMVYTVSDITQYYSPGSRSKQTGYIHDGQDPLPKEWRRRCHRSWLVEISTVGCPADDSLQTEVSEFADQLYPIIIPTKLDHNLFNKK